MNDFFRIIFKGAVSLQKIWLSRLHFAPISPCQVDQTKTSSRYLPTASFFSKHRGADIIRHNDYSLLNY